MTEQDEAAVGLSRSFSLRKCIILLIIAAITTVVWNLPSASFGIEGLTAVQQRIIAIFVFATLAWLTEPIPAWGTSIVIIALMCLTVSEHGLLPFKGEDVGQLLKAKDIMGTFADPVIILFLGGFILAIAASKSGLDVVLARYLILPFGNKSQNTLLGFLLITGFFSMFVSNTATAAMMLAFLAPLFAALPANGNARTALILAVPVGANIGGMGTPIGTPPNAIVMKVLNDPDGMNMGLGFGDWMLIMFPLTIVILLIAWRMILHLYPMKDVTVKLDIKGEMQKSWRMWVVVATFIITVLLWMIPSEYTGLDANVIALIPISVFTLTGVITASDLGKIDWSVIWMVAGGFALGVGLNNTGLADAAIKSLPFGAWSPLAILLISGLICFVLSNFISNTATVALLAPFIAVVCTGMGDKLDVIGGTPTVLIGIALAASAAMSLPISTPPNAIAYATGLVDMKNMFRVGLNIGIISMILSYIVLYFAAMAGLI